MPLKPSKNTGSGGSGSTTPYNPAGNGNYDFSDLIECSNAVGTYGSVTLALVSSGFAAMQYDDGYDGQMLFQSSTTASSGCSLRLTGASNIMPRSGDTCRFWFKMPSTIDSSSVVYCGFLDLFSSLTLGNAVGAKIAGSTYNACTSVSSSVTLSSNSVTLSPSSRYCVEVKYTSSTAATVKLYDSSNGNVLDTSNLTVNNTKRGVAIYGLNTGTVAKDIIIVDAFEYKLVARGVRLPT